MRHSHLLNPEQCLLLIIDVQEKFRHHIYHFSETVGNIVKLSKGAELLSVPVFITEQYPQGLGRIVPEITSCVKASQQFEKSAFSCCQDKAFVQALKGSGRTQLLVSGIEAHVCVEQTVLDLLALGYQVHIVCDAIASRTSENKQLGIAKMQAQGAQPTGVEMALLELVADSASANFKAVQSLIK